MASGFGLKGGEGRCYQVWLDFANCMKDASTPSACAAVRDDYFECLHQRKEIMRLNSVNQEYERQVKEANALEADVAQKLQKQTGKPMSDVKRYMGMVKQQAMESARQG
mmetsp:Transcript_8322/g.30702  ORF Transcript_8322/g.30702 Transcript_8322/m.30702 type:complete len:109 (-) Transcript_8322:117-443(-)